MSHTFQVLDLLLFRTLKRYKKYLPRDEKDTQCTFLKGRVPTGSAFLFTLRRDDQQTFAFDSRMKTDFTCATELPSIV
jgi:hypothetical protein